MMPLTDAILLVGYVACGYLFLSLITSPRVRECGMAVLNTAAVVRLFFWEGEGIQYWGLVVSTGMIFCSYALMKRTVRSRTSYPVLGGLILGWFALAKLGPIKADLGNSYLMFRILLSGRAVSKDSMALPTFPAFLSYCFFPLLYPIGPISSPSLYFGSLRNPESFPCPLPRVLLRIVVGGIKVGILAPSFSLLLFETYWFDGGAHGWTDLWISCVASYLYLYLYFSGACDLIIGTSALLNLRISENFDSPLLARNIADFWNRFHITLGTFMRDFVYVPILFRFGRWTGGKYLLLWSVISLLIVFFLIGLWHGLKWHYILTGILHGIAMVAFLLYSRLVKRLPPGFRKCASSPAVGVLSWMLTFHFVSMSCAVFLNEVPALEAIWRILNRSL